MLRVVVVLMMMTAADCSAPMHEAQLYTVNKRHIRNSYVWPSITFIGVYPLVLVPRVTVSTAVLVLKQLREFAKSA